MIFLCILLVVIVYMAIGLGLSSVLVRKHAIRYDVDIVLTVLFWWMTLLAVGWTYFNKAVVHIVEYLAYDLFNKKEKK